MTPTVALGWTLVHFLWQGTAIAAAVAVLRHFLRGSNAKLRYGLSCVALLLMLAAAVGTFGSLSMQSRTLQGALPATRSVLSGPTPAPAATALSALAASAPADTFQNFLPALVWAWFGGVIALSIRSLGGWVVAERFARRHTRRAEEVWQEKFDQLTQRLSISRPVRLAVSALAEVPAVIGWLRPVVLMPASIFAGLSAPQIEALLAHELAHIRRHDYLVNLFQTAVETLLFYHPAVWWLSRTIRVERENCCDDLAIKICGDTATYVRALTNLEEMRGARNVPNMAMAADGSSLLARVQRLLQRGPRAQGALASWLAVVGIAATLCVFGFVVNVRAQRPEAAPNPVEVVAPKAVAPEVVANPAAPILSAPTLLAQNQAPTPAPAKTAPAAANSKQTWLDEIQAAGFKDLSVDDMIAFKIHEVDGEYIRQMRATGLDLSKDQLIAFKIHEVSPAYITAMKQLGFTSLDADHLIAFQIHEVDAKFIADMRQLGFTSLNPDQLIALKIHEITPDFVRAARARFKDVTVDQLIALKIHEIL